ncbi:LacI family DNA-binding transcriptional regulator [Acuticoccus sp. MNP-M23]|uniref:LacI family DNA-binding transcriptional regulator n=1 Tax=Acuticoccus sp. MNP-M23 TaxID=3072793 RepID=UPI002814C88F|nr:LacI family DNA-binding transcriptional regulator [Acuticoccus sp. MNP-M23]WMS40903.1 LacI family DNA-binding transcriptional regulator [Acuticoccus sp. MNP-M23]
MSKPTVTDIGRVAGVSLATVDRVLNGRPGVRQITIDKVNAAIEEIGYVRDVAAANLARSRRYRFAFVLPMSASAFLGSVRASIADTRGTSLADRTDCQIIEVEAEDPHALVRTLRQLDGSEIDGVAILANETPLLRDEITALKARGVRVVAIISDLPSAGRDHFVGIDNIAAGRTAGVLMGRFLTGRPGVVITLANTMLSREAIERRRGFDEIIVERFPSLSVAPTIEIHDNPEAVRVLLPRILERRRDIVGLYSLGTGHRGMIDVLRRLKPAPPPVAIAHDLTSHLESALRDGIIDAVISQNVDHIVRSAIRVLRAKCDGVPIVASQERIRIEVILAENLPD